MKRLVLSSRGSGYLKRASEAAGATVLQSALLFLRLKFVALAAGAGGVGILALAQAYHNVFVGLSNLSSGNVFTRDISNAKSESEKKKFLNLCLFMGLFNGLVISIIGAVLWCVFYKDLDDVLYWSVAIFISIFFIANYNQIIYAMRGLFKTKLIFILNAYIFVIGFLLFAALYFLHIDLVWLFYIVVPISTLIGVALMKQCHDLFSGVVSQKLPLELLSYLRNNRVVFLFFGSLIVTSAQLFYRGIISEKFGLESLGYFQTAWMISSIVMMLNTNIMTSVYLPSLAPMENHHRYRASARQIFLNLMVLLPVVVVFIFYGPELLTMLASDDLVPALDVLYVLFMVDAIRCIVSTLGLLAFFKKDITAFLGVDIIGAVFPVVIIGSLEFDTLEHAVLWSQVAAGLLSLSFIAYRLIKYRELES